jgi:hypothetical protein
MGSFIICTHHQILLSRRMRWAGHVVRIGVKRNVNRVLGGKPAGKRRLGILRRRWEDGVKKEFAVIGWGGGVCGVDSPGSG